MGLLQDTYEKISKQSNKYGQYHKVLFHLHTYASHDYAVLEKYRNKDSSISWDELCELCYEKALFPREAFDDTLSNICKENTKFYRSNMEALVYLLIVWELMINKYELVVVTDHNNIDGYERLVKAVDIIYTYRKNYAKGKGYFAPKILLGIEVSCADKNHVVGIFDNEEVGIKEKIKRFIKENIMGDNSGSYQTSLFVLEEIEKMGGIGYIAHINSSPMLGAKKGEKFLSGTYTETLFSLLGLKIIGIHDKENLSNVREKISNYTAREFAYVIDSDSHSIDTIEKSFFWIKGEDINFKMIKEAVRDAAIAIQLDYPVPPKSFIEGILLKNNGTGFLCGKSSNELVLNLSSQLNCIIGGRGSGKSTLLNLMELVLGQNFTNDSMYNELCKYDQIWLLFYHNEKEYLINFMPMQKEYDNKSDFDELKDRTRETVHYLYGNIKLDKKFYREIILKRCIHVYPIENGTVAGKSYSNKIIRSFFDQSYSVNELVQTASSDEINEYITNIMGLTFQRGTRRRKIDSLTNLKLFLLRLDSILLNRAKSINKKIDQFNDCKSATGKIKIEYQQMKDVPNLIDFERLLGQVPICKINGEKFYRRNNITLDGVIGFLEKVYKENGLTKFLIILIDKMLVDTDVDIIKYCEANTEDIVDEGINIVSKDSSTNLLEMINDDILENSTDYLIKLMENDYPSKTETFSLLFNVMNKEGGEKERYKDVRELSLGQKVIAMLSFIFSYSEYTNDNRPLLIDQPEDNLDNQYIYKNLVDDLRKIKGNRQVIIATHSATIVTNAKAEQVVVLESDGNHGWISCRGYPTMKKIKQQIINYMEGGTESFLHKIDVYNEVLSQYR